jgi:hypothetical protein
MGSPNGQRNYEDFIERAKRLWGDKFDDSDLAPQFIPYFGTGQRIKIAGPRGVNGGEITGTVGVTTGWKPVFLLMRTSRSIGSSETLRRDDSIVAFQRGRFYNPVREGVDPADEFECRACGRIFTGRNPDSCPSCGSDEFDGLEPDNSFPAMARAGVFEGVFATTGEWAVTGFAELADRLVPNSGPADTLEGEVVRAIQHYSYRWFNDGDNTKADLNFIRRNISLFGDQADSVRKGLHLADTLPSYPEADDDEEEASIDLRMDDAITAFQNAAVLAFHKIKDGGFQLNRADSRDENEFGGFRRR